MLIYLHKFFSLVRLYMLYSSNSMTEFFEKKNARTQLIHKKAVYETKRKRFKKVGDIIHKLQSLFPDVTPRSEDEVCGYCYTKLLKKIAESNTTSSETPEDSSCVTSTLSSSPYFSDVSNHSYVPEQKSEVVRELNEKLKLHTSSISHLRSIKETTRFRALVEN